MVLVNVPMYDIKSRSNENNGFVNRPATIAQEDGIKFI